MYCSNVSRQREPQVSDEFPAKRARFTPPERSVITALSQDVFDQIFDFLDFPDRRRCLLAGKELCQVFDRSRFFANLIFNTKILSNDSSSSPDERTVGANFGPYVRSEIAQENPVIKQRLARTLLDFGLPHDQKLQYVATLIKDSNEPDAWLMQSDLHQTGYSNPSIDRYRVRFAQNEPVPEVLRTRWSSTAEQVNALQLAVLGFCEPSIRREAPSIAADLLDDPNLTQREREIVKMLTYLLESQDGPTGHHRRMAWQHALNSYQQLTPLSPIFEGFLEILCLHNELQNQMPNTENDLAISHRFLRIANKAIYGPHVRTLALVHLANQRLDKRTRLINDREAWDLMKAVSRKAYLRENLGVYAKFIQAGLQMSFPPNPPIDQNIANFALTFWSRKATVDDAFPKEQARWAMSLLVNLQLADRAQALSARAASEYAQLLSTSAVTRHERQYYQFASILLEFLGRPKNSTLRMSDEVVILRQMMDEMMDPSLLLNIKFLLVRIAHARLTVAADIPDNLIWQWIREVWDGSTVDCCNRLDLGLILVNLGQHVRVGSAEEELTARYLKELLEHPKGTQRQKMKLMLALANRHIKYGSAHVSQAEARHYLQSICGAAEADEAMRTAATQALGMLD